MHGASRLATQEVLVAAQSALVLGKLRLRRGNACMVLERYTDAESDFRLSECRSECTHESPPVCAIDQKSCVPSIDLHMRNYECIHARETPSKPGVKEVSSIVSVATNMTTSMAEALAQRANQITNESLSGLSEVRDSMEEHRCTVRGVRCGSRESAGADSSSVQN